MTRFCGFGFRCRFELSKLKVRAILFTWTPFIEPYHKYQRWNLTLLCDWEWRITLMQLSDLKARTIQLNIKCECTSRWEFYRRCYWRPPNFTLGQLGERKAQAMPLILTSIGQDVCRWEYLMEINNGTPLPPQYCCWHDLILCCGFEVQNRK